jgi:23S rRNA (adenine2503-C2)-methyltransferase
LPEDAPSAAELFVVEPEITTEQRSVDGTRKWLLRFPDGNEVETVNIPEDDRGSVSQPDRLHAHL